MTDVPKAYVVQIRHHTPDADEEGVPHVDETEKLCRSEDDVRVLLDEIEMPEGDETVNVNINELEVVA